MDALPGSAAADELVQLANETEEYEAVHEIMKEPEPSALRQHLRESGFQESDFAFPYSEIPHDLAVCVLDVSHYTSIVNETAVAAIVKYLGGAQRGPDDAYFSSLGSAEIGRVVEGFGAKKLGLDAKAAESALKAAAEKMRAGNSKSRVTLYYLMAESSGSIERLEKA